MAHGVKRADAKTGVGSRRIFAPHFKLQVLDSYRNDTDCKGNQRATARKYGIHRRQIQKWLQAENNLRNSVKGVQKSGFEARPRDDEKCPPVQLTPPEAPIDLSVKRSNDDVWDLSTKRRCLEEAPPPPPKPVKLFKPYLDDVNEGSNCSDDGPKLTELTPPPPCCANVLLPYINNNNNLEYAYTLQELQPSYYYMYPPPEYEQSSPPPLKQRQSYSVDFKLSAIECYYQDNFCRGNQRAVASKYNIHRRQVQKWLQQEDELRYRNETTKQMHVVR